MSLEQALHANTQAMNNLAAILAKTLPHFELNTEKALLAEVTTTSITPEADPEEVIQTSSTDKQEMPIEKESKSKKAKETAEPKETTAPKEEKAIAYEDVANAVTAYAKANGRDKAVELLARFGVKKGTELKPEQYADVLTTVSNLSA